MKCLQFQESSLHDRKYILCAILGKPEDLKTNVLPITQDLLKYYLHLKHKSNKAKTTGLISKIADSVIQIWETSLVPIGSKPHVTELRKKNVNIYANLKKSIGRKETKNFKLKLEAFQNSICKLFDISACKCTDSLECACRKEKKVPMEDRNFLLDQRSGWKMYIRLINKPATKEMEKFL